MDFGMIKKLNQLWNSLIKAHPNLPKFIDAVRNKKLVVGTKITIQFEYPDGSNIKGGIRVLESDLELMEEAKSLNSNSNDFAA